MSTLIKNELVKYVLKAEAHELNHEYEAYCMYPDHAPEDATPSDHAYNRGRKDAINEAIGILHKLAGLLS